MDLTNETTKALNALNGLDRLDLGIEIVIGKSNPNHESLRELVAQTPNMTLLVDVKDMAVKFARADLAIGAAGSTSWERACLGLPTLLIAVARNQESIGQGLATAGAARYLGPAHNVTEEILLEDRIH